MASRCRSFSRPAFNFLKSSINKPRINPLSSPRSTFSRLPSELGCIQSLLPLHSAISSSRLTSCLGISNSRSLSQGMLCRANPGV
ncbi:Protein NONRESPONDING TO OXYLIPINS 2 [Ranunculus cassubicifolius]